MSNETTTKKEWYFERVTFPSNMSAGKEYQHAEIRLYLRDKEPGKYSDTTATLTYQQHMDPEKKEWSGYYAEELTTRALDAESLKAITALFTRMQNFTESLNKRGLRVNAPYNDECTTREAQLIALKVTAIRRDRETGDIVSVSCSSS